MAASKLFAVIDVGSHEIQMKVAEISKGEPPRIIDSVSQTLPIGSDTYASGRISQPILNSCLQILGKMVRDLKAYNIKASRILATSAFREAENRAVALEQIAGRCGLQVEILSNAEERYYHILGIIGKMPTFKDLVNQGTMLADIGAGSIQLSVYDQGQFAFTQNMLLGSLRIRDLLADLEKRTTDMSLLMEEYISSDLATYHQLEPKGIVYKNLIVAGNETSYLKKLAGLEPRLLLTGKDFRQVYQKLQNIRDLDLSLEYDIPAEHASLLLPLAIIINKLINYTNVDKVFMPAASLCDGIILDYAGQVKKYLPDYDLSGDLISECRHLARRFKVNRKHSEAVEKFALQIFDETKRLHRMGSRQKLMLQVATLLHETGKYVNMSRHHMRTFNIIMASDLIGLSRREQEIVAWTARFHGDVVSFKLPGYENLSLEDQLIIAKLAAILRLADALDAGHKQKITGLQIKWDESSLLLLLDTVRDVTLEIWTIEIKGRLFNELFGLKPEARTRRIQS